MVIITKKLNGNPGDKISISGGSPVKCTFGAGGGKRLIKHCILMPLFLLSVMIIPNFLFFFYKKRIQRSKNNS